MTSALTPGDETGARAEVLSRVRRELAKVERGDVVSKSVEDMRCLLAELDRVTGNHEDIGCPCDICQRLRELSYRSGCVDGQAETKENYDAAIASRNAWAEKAEQAVEQVNRLREALGWMRQTIHHANGHDDALVICRKNTCQAASEALAATEPTEPKL